ncbi:MAG TPA: hypothetical protein VF817_02615 [Patescibacteria group bacterium]
MSLEQMSYEPTRKDLTKANRQMSEAEKNLSYAREEYFEKFGIKDVELLKEVASLKLTDERIEKGGSANPEKEVRLRKLNGILRGRLVELIKETNIVTLPSLSGPVKQEGKSHYNGTIGDFSLSEHEMEAEELFEKYFGIKSKIDNENKWAEKMQSEKQKEIDFDKLMKEYL